MAIRCSTVVVHVFFFFWQKVMDFGVLDFLAAMDGVDGPKKVGVFELEEM